MKKFGRKIKFTIDFIDGTSLTYDENMWIDFSVVKFFDTTSDGLNTATVAIKNLNTKNRGLIEKTTADKIGSPNEELATLSLYAGYDSYDLIFKGKIKNVGQEKLDTDIQTTIYCYDSSLDNVINKSIKSQTVQAFFTEIAGELGVEISVDPKIDRVITNTSYNGDLMSVLKEMSEDFGFYYYMDNETLFISSTTADITQEKTISRQNGLVGIPQISSKGAFINMMLDGTVSIGDYINLDAEFGDFNIGNLNFTSGVLSGTTASSLAKKFSGINGQYYIKQVEHIGQSRGDLFLTKLTCLYPEVV